MATPVTNNSSFADGKQGPIQVFSGSLASAGALSASNGLSVHSYGYATIYVQYVSGSATGSVKFYAQTSPDAGTTWFDKTVLDVPVSGALGLVSNLDTQVCLIPAQGSCAKEYTVSVFGADKVRFQFAETGSIAAPGQVFASVVLKNHS